MRQKNARNIKHLFLVMNTHISLSKCYKKIVDKTMLSV